MNVYTRQEKCFRSFFPLWFIYSAKQLDFMNNYKITSTHKKINLISYVRVLNIKMRNVSINFVHFVYSHLCPITWRIGSVICLWQINTFFLSLANSPKKKKRFCPFLYSSLKKRTKKNRIGQDGYTKLRPQKLSNILIDLTLKSSHKKVSTHKSLKRNTVAFTQHL